MRFPEQVPELLDRAYAIATSTPEGPGLPQPAPRGAVRAVPGRRARCPDRHARRVDRGRARPDRRRGASCSPAPSAPLIVAQRGAGSPAGFEALARIAEQWSIPVCQYWANATAISAEHPMYVGQDPSPWVAEADVILVIDSLAPWMPDLHEPAAGLHGRAPRAEPVVQPRSRCGTSAPTCRSRPRSATAWWRSNGRCASVADGADSQCRTRRRALVDDRNATRREQSRADVAAGAGTPMTKAWVSQCVGEAIRGHVATVISELGCTFDQLGLTDHGSWRQEPHSGGLGWGLPCAMGIKLADPERLVVATMGDGSYMFANPVACHHVAEAHDIPVLTVVLNNAGYGAVRHSVLDLYPTGYAAKADEVPLTALSPTPDFAQVARACRAHAETVTDGADLPPRSPARSTSSTVEHRQALLDVHVA